MGNLRRAWWGRAEAQPGPGQAAQDHTQWSAWDSPASGTPHGPGAFRGHRAELTTPVPALLSVAGGGGVGGNVWALAGVQLQARPSPGLWGDQSPGPRERGGPSPGSRVPKHRAGLPDSVSNLWGGLK